MPHAADRLRGVVEANVTVARPLADDQQEAVRARLEALTGQTVRLAVREDPSLLGGDGGPRGRPGLGRERRDRSSAWRHNCELTGSWSDRMG